MIIGQMIWELSNVVPMNNLIFQRARDTLVLLGDGGSLNFKFK